MIWLSFLVLGFSAFAVVWFVVWAISRDDQPKGMSMPPPNTWVKHPKDLHKPIEIPLPNKIVLKDGLKQITEPGEIEQPFEKLKQSLGMKDEE
jgi:hypothetical protein